LIYSLINRCLFYWQLEHERLKFICSNNIFFSQFGDRKYLTNMTLIVNGSMSFFLLTPIYSFVDWTWQTLNIFCLPMKKKRDRQNFFPSLPPSRFFRCWMWNGKLFVNHLRMPSTMSMLLCYYRMEKDRDMLHEPENV
jgi:hypothetical protein